MGKFSERLLRFIDSKGITVNKLETKAGLGSGTIGKAISKNTTLGVDKIEKIFRIYPDLNVQWLITGEGEMDLSQHLSPHLSRQSPKVKKPEALKPDGPIITIEAEEHNPKKGAWAFVISQKAAAGWPAHLADKDWYHELPRVPVPFFRSGDYAWVQASGDSMQATITHGDWLLASRVYDFKEVKEAYIYIIVTEEGVMVKRLINRLKQRGKIVCKSDNRAYPLFEVDPEHILQVWYVHMKLTPILTNPAEDLRGTITSLQIDLKQLEDKVEAISHTVSLQPRKK